jgi:hypothetical protein
MKPERAIRELEALKAEADSPEVQRSTPEHKRWKASVVAVMTAALPPESATLAKFSNVRYSVGIWSGAPGEAERDARFFAGRVRDAVALIDAAIYELGLLAEDDVDATAFDTELWLHVRHSVDEGRWEQVASAAATFVEDKVRRWSGNPQDDKGNKMFGQPLFAQAFADGGPLRLGSQANEVSGWRNLAIGFTAALGNVDRHNIQERADLRLYALGVLGLASLLLTQIRYEHPDAVADSGRRR